MSIHVAVCAACLCLFAACFSSFSLFLFPFHSTFSFLFLFYFILFLFFLSLRHLALPVCPHPPLVVLQDHLCIPCSLALSLSRSFIHFFFSLYRFCLSLSALVFFHFLSFVQFLLFSPAIALFFFFVRLCCVLHSIRLPVCCGNHSPLTALHSWPYPAASRI